MSGGVESTNGFSKINYLAELTSPIGPELSYGLSNSGSLAILLSVLDFGPPINSKLYNINKSFRLYDLIVPGIYLIYGFPELPISVSCGYYNGTKLHLPDLINSNHFQLLIAFDMPLFLFL